ncbi:MAG: LexA family protein [Moorellaceae bacterium]
MARKAEDEAFGRRLRETREALGITRQELAEKTGLSAYKIQRLELGYQTATYEDVNRIARALNIEPSVLTGEGTPDSEPRNIDDIVNHILARPLSAVLRWKRVPLVEKVVRGEELFAMENVVDYVNLPEYREADFAVEVPEEDAAVMGPALKKGDILICRQSPPVDGELVVLYPSEATQNALVRYLVRHGKGWALRTMNPFVEDMPVDPEEVVAGTVVYVISRAGTYNNLFVSAGDLNDLGITKEDLGDPTVREAIRLVGRAKNRLSDEDKENMLALMEGWLRALEQKKAKKGGE